MRSSGFPELSRDVSMRRIAGFFIEISALANPWWIALKALLAIFFCAGHSKIHRF
jgi:hypothetical protein